jgi:diaminohydroxyphosphoribosylaminopyrimidine deaminase/5-amino-6-(5-phosphoribosylamino)uracil reductase
MTRTPDSTPWTDEDCVWMQHAFSEAVRGLGHVEPNPLVGAALVREGKLIAVGHHARFGGPHAEVEALERAGSGARGATLYVTLEPCCHHGKTPPCTAEIIKAGVTRVVAATRDPFPKVDGGGFRELQAAGVEVFAGLFAEQARRLNAPYFKRLATGRPFVIAKWAMTLDGKIATRTGNSQWISNTRSRAVVHELRGRVDAIVVGIGTVLSDDPTLTARPAGPRTATRIVLDSSVKLPLTSRLLKTVNEAPVLLAHCGESNPHTLSLSESGCQILSFPNEMQVPVGALLDTLGGWGHSNALVEGGGRVLGSFFDAGEVDAVEVFIAPRIAGGAQAWSPVLGVGVALISHAPALENLHVAQLSGDLHIRGTIKRSWWEMHEPHDPP